MIKSKIIDLPSGAKLDIRLAPFIDSKNLYQAILEEIKSLKLDPHVEIDTNLFKDLFCTGFSSKKIESCISECMKYVTYNGFKIDHGTFEPEKAREDYLVVCFEIAKENVLPFTKTLMLQYSQVLGLLRKNNPA